MNIFFWPAGNVCHAGTCIYIKSQARQTQNLNNFTGDESKFDYRAGHWTIDERGCTPSRNLEVFKARHQIREFECSQQLRWRDGVLMANHCRPSIQLVAFTVRIRCKLEVRVAELYDAWCRLYGGTVETCLALIACSYFMCSNFLAFKSSNTTLDYQALLGLPTNIWTTTNLWVRVSRLAWW